MTIVFKTKRLLIRYATEQDTEMYFALWTDPQVMANVGFPQGLRITQDEIITKIKGQVGGEYGRLLVIEHQKTSKTIGECKLYLPDVEGISRTDVKLLPRYWDHKYGVEVKQALVDYLFAHTNCRAVEGSPNINNTASIKMQKAVGGVFVRETLYEFPESMQAFTHPVHAHIYRVYRTDIS